CYNISSSFSSTPPPPGSPLFPYTTLFRSRPFSTARSGRRGSLTMSVGPLSIRSPLPLTSMYPCRPLGRLKMISPPSWRKERSSRSEEHTSELQSPCNLVCRLLLEKKKKIP